MHAGRLSKPLLTYPLSAPLAVIASCQFPPRPHVLVVIRASQNLLEKGVYPPAFSNYGAT